MGRFSGFLDHWSRWPKLSRIGKEFMKTSFRSKLGIIGLLLWLLMVGVMIFEAIVDGSCSASIVLMEMPLRLHFMAEGVLGFGSVAPVWFDVTHRPIVRNRERVGKKKRRRRLPWFRRSKTRESKRVTKRPGFLGDEISEWIKGWADIPVRYVPTIPEMFDEACRANPEFLDLLCGFGRFKWLRCLSLTENLALTENLVTCVATLKPLVYNNLSPVDGCVQLQSVYFGAMNDTPIVFDTGASTGVTPHRDDFIDFTLSDSSLTGIAQQARVRGSGTVSWTVRDDTGQEHALKTRALYVPDAQVRLFSPQVHLQLEARGGRGEFRVTEKGSVFRFPFTKKSLTFHATHDRLPIARLATDAVDDLSAFPSFTPPQVAVEENVHLSPGQCELKLLHDRLGHFNFPWIQRLTRVREGDRVQEPILRTKYKSTSSCVGRQQWSAYYDEQLLSKDDPSDKAYCLQVLVVHFAYQRWRDRSETNRYI
jgi:hypothetical protein